MRDIMQKHNTVINKLRQKLAEADKEGEGRPQWKLEQRTVALEEAKKASTVLRADLKVAASIKCAAARDVFNETRKSQSKRAPTPQENLYWLQQVQNTFAGRSPEQCLELYDYQLKKMTPEEKLAWRYVFDDGLQLATFGDPALEFQAAQAIDKHRTPDEKAALKAMREAERFEDFVPTLTAVFETNFTEATEGEKQANDPEAVFNTIQNDIKAELAKV